MLQIRHLFDIKICFKVPKAWPKCIHSLWNLSLYAACLYFKCSSNSERRIPQQCMTQELCSIAIALWLKATLIIVILIIRLMNECDWKFLVFATNQKWLALLHFGWRSAPVNNCVDNHIWLHSLKAEKKKKKNPMKRWHRIGSINFYWMWFKNEIYFISIN